MVPKKDAPATVPVDPRSMMTDRTMFLPRSLHTPKHLAIFAAYIAKHEKITDPEVAMKRACKLCELTGDYRADPTYAKAVENADERMAEE
jgi:hypothetical protein